MQNPNVLILIVDDLLTMRKSIKKLCKSFGFSKFLEAVNGPDALVKLKESPLPIQLIISDLDLPNSSGLDLLREVRLSSTTKNIPFLVMVDESQIHQIQLAEEYGVSAYLIKPFTESGLKQSLENILASQDVSGAA